jgi:peptidoglycan/LPS O-acetylase OafA/YrhL
VKSERSELIDLLKVGACFLIVWHHLALYSPMSDVVSEWFPAFEEFLFEHGLLAVQVFLVVGGYLNAKSWIRALSQVEFQVGPRIWARYERLVMPLLAALSFTVLVTALVRPFFDHSALSAPPTPLQIFAHIFFLQDVLYLEAFSAGVWYVAIDFQLFVIAIAGAWLAHAWQRLSSHGSVIMKALALWLLLTLASIFYWNLNPLDEIWGTYFFSAYGLGLCVGCWRYAGIRLSHSSLALILMLLGALATAYQPRIRLVVALVTSVLLTFYEAGNRKPIESLKAEWIRQLSNATYAIFLIHFGVSLVVSAIVFNFWSENIPINLMGLLMAFVASIWLGRLIHVQIETKPPSLKRWLQWAAIFSASSAAAMWLS